MLSKTPTTIWSNPIHFTAFGFGSGAMPWMPGTWGTVVGVLFYLLLQDFSASVYLAIVFVMAVVGVWLCAVTSRDLGVHDHPGIVWDEIVGYLLTMVFAPKGLAWIVLGFALFRLFDILKPWPIKMIDKKIKGGLGIMLDDILAAIPAGLILWVMSYLLLM